MRTRSFDDARQLALAAVAQAAPAEAGRRPDVLVMMGGDGMASLGLNACAGSHIPLAIIPTGTGDDFARGVGIPRKPAEAVQAIITGHTKMIDMTRRSTIGSITPG